MDSALVATLSSYHQHAAPAQEPLRYRDDCTSQHHTPTPPTIRDLLKAADCFEFLHLSDVRVLLMVAHAPERSQVLTKALNHFALHHTWVRYAGSLPVTRHEREWHPYEVARAMVGSVIADRLRAFRNEEGSCDDQERQWVDNLLQPVMDALTQRGEAAIDCVGMLMTAN